VGNTGPAVDQIEKAKAVCARCPIRLTKCPERVDLKHDSGIWFGVHLEQWRKDHERTHRRARYLADKEKSA